MFVRQNYVIFAEQQQYCYCYYPGTIPTSQRHPVRPIYRIDNVVTGCRVSRRQSFPLVTGRRRNDHQHYSHFTVDRNNNKFRCLTVSGILCLHKSHNSALRSISAPAVCSLCSKLWVPARRYRVVNKGKPAQRSVVLWRRWFVVVGMSGGGDEVVRRQTCVLMEKRSARGIVAADRRSTIDSSATPKRQRHQNIRSCDGVSVIGAALSG